MLANVQQVDPALNEISQMSTDDIISRTRLLDNECKVGKFFCRFNVFFSFFPPQNVNESGFTFADYEE